VRCLVVALAFTDLLIPQTLAHKTSGVNASVCKHWGWGCVGGRAQTRRIMGLICFLVDLKIRHWVLGPRCVSPPTTPTKPPTNKFVNALTLFVSELFTEHTAVRADAMQV
jgi:hypothetical protein